MSKAPSPAETPACYAACPCGAMVLTGATPTGERVVLEPNVKTYSVQMDRGSVVPTMHESMAYPVHLCAAAMAPRSRSC